MLKPKKYLRAKCMLYACCMIVFCVCSSCSRKSSDVHNSSTLREEAVILESRISWAKELPVSAQEYNSITKDVGKDPVLIILSQELTEQASASVLKYPSLPNFPELDVTAYNAAQKTAIDSFCQALLKNDSPDKYIMSGYTYTLVLFRYNLEKQKLSFRDMTDYVLGKPFINENECQCPVRLFFNDETHADINLYIAKSGPNWKIHQIEYIIRESNK